MTYLYEKDRENFARKILEAAGVDQNLWNDLIFKFRNLNGLDIGNTEQEKMVKWCRNNQYEAKKQINENLSNPSEIVSKIRSLI